MIFKSKVSIDEVTDFAKAFPIAKIDDARTVK